MPKPPPRDGEISDEVLSCFDRAVQLRAEIAERENELGAVEKRLIWTLMPEIFGREHWGPHCPSPADEELDEVRHAPVGGGCQLDLDWPNLQRDRRALLKAHAEWKKQR